MKQKLLLSCFLFLSLGAEPLLAQEIVIPYDTTTTRIDGVMSPGEWTTAIKIVFHADKDVNVYVKHDSTALYFAFSGKLETHHHLYPEVLIDPAFRHTDTWAKGMWWFHVSATDCEHNGAYGRYNSCAEIQPGWKAEPNFGGRYYADDVEIKIPFRKIDFNPETQDSIGLALILTNTATLWATWPSKGDREMPSTWSKAILAKKVEGTN